MPTTDQRGWTIPTPGSDAGTWDEILNDLIDDEIEADLTTVETTANAAMPKAGGDFTGEIGIKTEKYDLVNKGNMSGTVTIDVSTGNFQYGTATGTITFAFSNWPAGHAAFITLEITNGGSQTVNWPAAVKWDGGSAPTLTSSGVDVIVLYSRDGGTTIRGAHSMQTAS